MNKVYQETMFLLKKYHITANKKLGQNFLIEDSVVNKTVESANITKKDLVIEIGPGLGTLTSLLLEKAKKVIAIELDERMVTILKERFALSTNLEIIQKDILQIDLKQLLEQEKKESEIQKIKVVANLPYYITTPIIMKLLEDKLLVETITIMIQKEVADRLTALPGEKLAGAITYSVNYYAEARKIIEVPKESFLPVPEVESTVIELKLREKPKVMVQNEKKFFALIKTSFMQRRKTFLNGVSNGGFVEKEQLKQILQELNLPENIRGENLSLEQFAQIANQL